LCAVSLAEISPHNVRRRPTCICIGYFFGCIRQKTHNNSPNNCEDLHQNIRDNRFAAAIVTYKKPAQSKKTCSNRKSPSENIGHYCAREKKLKKNLKNL